MTRKTVHPRSTTLRSAGNANDIGAAPSGSRVWLAERLTSLALVPLTLWFIVMVIRLEGATRDDMTAWLSAPVSLVLLLSLVVITFWHMELGLRVVIDDYVHSNPAHQMLMIVQRGVCIVAGVSCVIAALSLGLSEGGG